MVNWEKETKKLQKEVEILKSRIKENARERDKLIERKEEAEQRLSFIDGRVKEIRVDRQRLLALGEDVSKLTEELRRLQDERDLRSDEIAGIQSRVNIISDENEGLYKEKMEIEREILVLKAVPLRDEYNRLASELARVVTDVWGLIKELGEEPGSPNCRAFFASNWGGALRLIPRLYDPAEFIKSTPIEVDLKIHGTDFFRK